MEIAGKAALVQTIEKEGHIENKLLSSIRSATRTRFPMLPEGWFLTLCRVTG